MANVKLLFWGTERSQSSEHQLEVIANDKNEIYINIDMDNENGSYICLDKMTAVRLVRELKKQIGYLESEVQND
jgi:hypothetical protein